MPLFRRFAIAMDYVPFTWTMYFSQVTMKYNSLIFSAVPTLTDFCLTWRKTFSPNASLARKSPKELSSSN